VYDGIVKLECNSHKCDTPYHFLQFTRVPDNYIAPSGRNPARLYIPSVEHAKQSMLTWREFVDERDYRYRGCGQFLKTAAY